jgi:hypothetical protein
MVKHSHDPWLYAEPQATSWETHVPLRLTITLWNMGEAEKDLPGEPRWPVSEVTHLTIPPHQVTGHPVMFKTCPRSNNLSRM